MALRLGFVFDRGRGSHRVYVRPDGRRVVIPFHGGRTIPAGTLRSIIEDLGISVEQFNRSV
ncbi:MAG: type II toxin-antitoxin system HicA family toxin [Planctomycetes bacterium]|nr:type II toxin-antitoxin system HicA family toxin [Planctomycetota bacterium]